MKDKLRVLTLQHAARLSKLQNATAAVLAQANQQPSLVLKLIQADN